MHVTKEIFRLIDTSDVSRFGAIAQLVEHLHGMQGVSGSSPLGSISINSNFVCFRNTFLGIFNQLYKNVFKNKYLLFSIV